LNFIFEISGLLLFSVARRRPIRFHCEPDPAANAITSAHFVPIAALVGGVPVLSVPRVLGFVAAGYLIVVGFIGLNGIYHLIRQPGSVLI